MILTGMRLSHMTSRSRPLPQRLTQFLGVVALVASELASAGQVSTDQFNSTTLKRPYPYTMYWPDAPPQDGASYPVIYLLHGSLGSEQDWLAKGGLEATADRLIAEGQIPPVIVVMPGSKSWWLDGYNEAAETALLKDLIPHIEATLPVSKRREKRFVAGLSAGGYGATRLALLHPELFGAAAALSPAVYDPIPPEHSSAYQHPAFLDASGEFDLALWGKSNYPSYWDSYIAQSAIVPFYITSGDHDEFDIARHAAILFTRLRRHQPDAVELRIVDGGHDWNVWSNTLPDTLIFLLTRYSL